MRFRAKLLGKNASDLLTKTFQILEKNNRQCVLLLSSSHRMRIVSKSDEMRNFQIWTTIPREQVFADYRIESNNDNNAIALRITDIRSAIRAMKSVESCVRAVIKLAKPAGHPVLRVEMEAVTHIGSTTFITQDILVEVILMRHFLDHYVEPGMGEQSPNASVYLPKLKELRPVLDHMKNISDSIDIGVTTEGRMTLRVDNDLSSIVVYRKNLQVPAGGFDLEHNDGDARSEMKIDIRQLIKVVRSQALLTEVTCALFEGHMMICLGKDEMTNTSMVFYLPAIS